MRFSRLALLSGVSAASLAAQRAERQPTQPVAQRKARRQGGRAFVETRLSDQT